MYSVRVGRTGGSAKTFEYCLLHKRAVLTIQIIGSNLPLQKDLVARLLLIDPLVCWVWWFMSEHCPDPVDIHVGARVRMRRLMLGLSQDKLAETIGLTFQQIQKYEKGANRIGASRLFQLANALDVPVQFFYEDLQKEGGDSTSSHELLTLLATPDGMRLCRYFADIKDVHVKRRLLDLVKSLSSQSQTLGDTDKSVGADTSIH